MYMEKITILMDPWANYVDWIDLLDESGNIINCSLKKNKELFLWTIGGMGLTGIIVRAAIHSSN